MEIFYSMRFKKKKICVYIYENKYIWEKKSLLLYFWEFWKYFCDLLHFEIKLIEKENKTINMVLITRIITENRWNFDNLGIFKKYFVYNN